MAHYTQFQAQLKVDPPLPPESKVSVASSAHTLMTIGFNLPVIITSIPLDKEERQPKSALVMAHFDTGASGTSIDVKLAQELELFPIGKTNMQTAAGIKEVSKYLVSVSFPNSQLKGYKLSVSDCNLPYNGNPTDMNPQNFCVLLGRDIMAHWNIVWNGPSSTVLISD
jgi:hypothetical protein